MQHRPQPFASTSSVSRRRRQRSPTFSATRRSRSPSPWWTRPARPSPPVTPAPAAVAGTRATQPCARSTSRPSTMSARTPCVRAARCPLGSVSPRRQTSSGRECARASRSSPPRGTAPASSPARSTGDRRISTTAARDCTTGLVTRALTATSSSAVRSFRSEEDRSTSPAAGSTRATSSSSRTRRRTRTHCSSQHDARWARTHLPRSALRPASGSTGSGRRGTSGAR